MRLGILRAGACVGTLKSGTSKLAVASGRGCYSSLPVIIPLDVFLTKVAFHV